MRWRGAVYFSFLPTLFMFVMQASVIYSESRYGPMYWHLKLVEPMLFITPVCLLMAWTGYAVAIRCSSITIGRAVLVGGAVGAAWALVAMIAGNTIAQLHGAEPLSLDRVIRVLMMISAICVPLAVVLCIFTRWRGLRRGFAPQQQLHI